MMRTPCHKYAFITYLNVKANKIKSLMVFVMVILGVVMVGCNVGKCNKDLLNQTTGSPASVFSDTFTLGKGAEAILEFDSIINSYSVSDIKWEIAPQGLGCLVSLTAAQNGNRVDAIKFFVDLEKAEIYPQNTLVKAVFAGIYYSGETTSGGGLPLQK